MGDEDETLPDSDAEIDVIDLHLCHGKILVWNSQDVKVLREVHHIVGSLVGALPRAPRQNSLMGLPLQLMPEEANVLLEYGAARLINIKTHKPHAEQVTQFEEYRKESFEKQKELWKEKKTKKREELSHIIGLGRMSRKQRRAEKARKRKLQQEEALLKKRKLEAPEVQIHDQLRRQTNIDFTEEPHDQIKREPHDHEQTNQGANTESHDKSADNRTIKESHDPLDTELKQESNKMCHPTADTNKPQALDSSNPTNLTKTQQDELIIKANNKIGDSSNKSEEKFQRSIKQGLTCTDIRTNEMDNDDTTLTINVEETDKQLHSKPSEIIQRDKDKPEKETSNKGLGDDVLKRDDTWTVQKKSKTSTQYAGDQDKTERQQSEDQGCLIQLFTGTPNINPRNIQVPDWDFPETPEEIMRCSVFKNFWEQGYYITSGSKFGGDFLAYPGDPFLYHSFYIIICLPYQKTISPLDIVAWGRMASNVKKSVVLCSVDETDEVVYTSVQWTGIT